MVDEEFIYHDIHTKHHEGGSMEYKCDGVRREEKKNGISLCFINLNFQMNSKKNLESKLPLVPKIKIGTILRE